MKTVSLFFKKRAFLNDSFKNALAYAN